MSGKAYRIAKWGGLTLVIGTISVYFALCPSPNADPQQLAELRYNPVAAAIGSAIPAIALGIVGYFGVPVFERWMRRRKSKKDNDRLQLEDGRSPTAEADEALWASVLQEYESPSRKAGLYARLCAELGGNEPKVKAAYLKARVAQKRPIAEQTNFAAATPVPSGVVDGVATEQSHSPPAPEETYRKMALYMFFGFMVLIIICFAILLAVTPK